MDGWKKENESRFFEVEISEQIRLTRVFLWQFYVDQFSTATGD